MEKIESSRELSQTMYGAIKSIFDENGNIILNPSKENTVKHSTSGRLRLKGGMTDPFEIEEYKPIRDK